jgi:hypothetical protein
MIIELDKKLTLLPHPHPSSLLFLTLKKLFGISPWDISLSFFGVLFQAYGGAFYRPSFMLHGQQSPSRRLKSIFLHQAPLSHELSSSHLEAHIF